MHETFLPSALRPPPVCRKRSALLLKLKYIKYVQRYVRESSAQDWTSNWIADFNGKKIQRITNWQEMDIDGSNGCCSYEPIHAMS
eukprot:scaffold3595_cov235-Ochromonas_danica.AAC.4